MSDSEFSEFDYDDSLDIRSECSLYSSEDDSPEPSIQHENGTYYHPWTLTEFVQTHLDLLKKLKNSGLTCPEDELLVILHYSNWRPEEAINAYFEDKDRLYSAAGLPLVSTFSTKTDFTCDICCDTYATTRTYQLQCGHEFCISCWNSYSRDHINKGQLVRCMTPDCMWTIPHADLEEFAESDLFTLHKPLVDNILVRSAARRMVDANPRYKWCPATDCTDFTELLRYTNASSSDEDDSEYTLREQMENKSSDLTRVPIVKCHSGHEFCFYCNYENHLPCPCWIVKLWVKKCSDDSETANWIEANTHQCPKCEQNIEKNGGCNHMTCKTCKYEFCWICLNDWSDHNQNFYQCNRYKEDIKDIKDKEEKKSKSRQSLNRYIHFYKRFTIHETSMKLDNKVLLQINNIAIEFLENRRSDSESAHSDTTTWSDVQFLPDAMRALHNGRKTLKWTYTFLFYLQDLNFQRIFELNQSYLNLTVEDLSELFEKIIHASKLRNGDSSKLVFENKSKIMDLAKLVNGRQKKLIEGANASLAEGLISFE